MAEQEISGRSGEVMDAAVYVSATTLLHLKRES